MLQIFWHYGNPEAKFKVPYRVVISNGERLVTHTDTPVASLLEPIRNVVSIAVAQLERRFIRPGPCPIVLVCLYLNPTLSKGAILDAGQVDALRVAAVRALRRCAEATGRASQIQGESSVDEGGAKKSGGASGADLKVNSEAGFFDDLSQFSVARRIFQLSLPYLRTPFSLRWGTSRHSPRPTSALHATTGENSSHQCSGRIMSPWHASRYTRSSLALTLLQCFTKRHASALSLTQGEYSASSGLL